METFRSMDSDSLLAKSSMNWIFLRLRIWKEFWWLEFGIYLSESFVFFLD